MIAVKLYIPEAQAEANEMVYGDKLKRYILLNVQTSCTAEEGESNKLRRPMSNAHRHYLTCGYLATSEVESYEVID